jgi:hypothetical protein
LSEQGTQYKYIYIKIVRSLQLLSALLNWFKLFYGLFCQSNMHCTLDIRADQTEKKLNELLRSISIISNAQHHIADFTGH